MVFEGLRDYDGCPVAVLDVCGMGDQPQQVSVCVGYDVTLTPLCFLARIIATRAATLGRLDRLAVDDPSGGRGLPPRNWNWWKKLRSRKKKKEREPRAFPCLNESRGIHTPSIL